MNPVVSVIVPAYNEARFIAHTIAAAQAAATQLHDETGCGAEIIVIDNNSTDDTAGVARQAGARVVFEPKRGIASARNCGARHALSPYLLFVDADTLPAPNLLVEVYKALAGGRVSGGSINLREDSGTIRWRFNFFMTNLFSPLVNFRGGVFYCRRDDFEAIGGFDEQLASLEDVRFFHQLRRAGRQTGRRFKHVTSTHAVTSARKLDGKWQSFLKQNGWEVIRAFLTAVSLRRHTRRSGSSRA